MKTLLNLVWLIFSGLWIALGYLVAGVICCVLVITLPWGLACFRIAGYALWPFGRTTVERRGAGVPSAIGNVVWLVFAGIWLTIGHITAGVAFCLTIVGIPFGLAHFKMIPLSLTPLGRDIVSTDTASAYPHYRW
ncbi:YccF domain-containing protein [Streptomyces sp. AJS327]|uniref:YccF domain-containing protein n=1 Tax=Streptomyces sp. AJS327 TaxID=2545265 RepID=UPI0015DE31EB|nr:YccF domain-containing protein [Streptomyces sp. AJS327]MBA0054041.1 YccF domain-containing protein [Streptomyces sp. AJS327]